MSVKSVFRAEHPDSTTPAQTIDRIALALNVGVLELIKPSQVALLVESLEHMDLVPSPTPKDVDFHVDTHAAGLVLSGTLTCRQRTLSDDQPTDQEDGPDASEN